jgi:tetratricopeptide (TPR) repeat protein
MVGGRKILELDPGVPLPEFERILRDNAVAYVISPVRWDAMGAFEFQTRESKRLRFEPAYSVASLHLYRISSRFTEPGVEDTAQTQGGDSLTAGGLLRRGRRLLMSGKYPEASSVIAKSLELAPFQPEVRYQFAVARAFLGDTAAAFQAFRSILTLPQAGSYLYITRQQIEALSLLVGGKSGEPDREMRAHDASSIYWNLGYPLRASQVTDSSFRESGKYFFGLLWGFHYAYQAGDVKSTAAYNERLRAIDSTNAVVRVFQELIAIRDSLKLPLSGERRSRLHLRAGSCYRRIELPEEAIDEGERAVGENPRSPEAAGFLAGMYETKKSARGMWKWLSAEASLDPSRTDLRARRDSLATALNP